MNGNQTVEQIVAEARSYAQAAASAVLEARRDFGNAVGEVHQALGRMLGEVGTARGEVESLRLELRQALKEFQKKKPAVPSSFNPTDTGTHFLVPADELDDLLEKRQQRDQAKKWEHMKKLAWSVFKGALIGAATLAGAKLLGFIHFHVGP